MITLDIIQTILVKQVLTESSKQLLAKKFSNEKEQLERESQQLRFEMRKLSNKLTISKQELQKRFETELSKRKDKMAIVDFKIAQLDELALGQEIIEKEVECVINIGVGDNWHDKMKQKAIIIQDGIVIRID